MYFLTMLHSSNKYLHKILWLHCTCRINKLIFKTIWVDVRHQHTRFTLHHNTFVGLTSCVEQINGMKWFWPPLWRPLEDVASWFGQRCTQSLCYFLLRCNGSIHQSRWTEMKIIKVQLMVLLSMYKYSIQSTMIHIKLHSTWDMFSNWYLIYMYLESISGQVHKDTIIHLWPDGEEDMKI